MDSEVMHVVFVDIYYTQFHNALWYPMHVFFFFFNDTATTEIYTLSLHDALPIFQSPGRGRASKFISQGSKSPPSPRSEEHTSELQSQSNLVCRLLLEKKNINTNCRYT